MPADGDVTAAADVLAAAQRQQERRQLLDAPGAAQLTPAQAAVRVAFFLWASLLNLVTVSSLWARSADVFNPEAAGRLFGLLGAGATLGQLVGSLAAGALAGAPVLRGSGGAGPSLLPLLVSAAALELAGQAAGRYKVVKGAVQSGSPVLANVEVEDGGGMVKQASSSSLACQGSASHMARAVGKCAPPGAGLAAADGSSAGGGGGGKAGAGSVGAVGRRAGAEGGSLLDQLLRRTLEGYRLIKCAVLSPGAPTLPALPSGLFPGLPCCMPPMPAPSPRP